MSVIGVKVKTVCFMTRKYSFWVIKHTVQLHIYNSIFFILLYPCAVTFVNLLPIAWLFFRWIVKYYMPISCSFLSRKPINLKSCRRFIVVGYFSFSSKVFISKILFPNLCFRYAIASYWHRYWCVNILVRVLGHFRFCISFFRAVCSLKRSFKDLIE